jgi:prepilin-type N-terminal cleavage/methylation domain-containing protein
MKNQRGFTLFELIAVIVLVGIIAAFATFFLFTGARGYLKTKNATEGALNAQMALDRISLELRNISELTSPPSSTSLSYKSEDKILTGSRTLKYENQKVFIRVDGTDYMLLDNISTFSICKLPQNLDYHGSNDDVSYIEVGFKVNEIGKEFKTRIFPRNMVEDKWPDRIQCE